MANSPLAPPPLPPVLSPVSATSITYMTPKKRIISPTDLSYLPSTPAYELLTSFLTHLSASVTPLSPHTHELRPASRFYTNNPDISVSENVQKLVELLKELSFITSKAPPTDGPRRFGNPAFRTWHSLATNHISNHLHNHIPENCHPALPELQHYLVASLGSAQRIDYGTGHELDFTAFLAGLWKLGALGPGDEPAIVLKLFNAYFELIRKLVVEYNLEPAGSHGVWGLDDHSFLPYIFGSAQLTTYLPALNPPETIEQEGHDHLPKPADVAKKEICERWADKNMYFAAVNFIHCVKTGPFWEHSPMLYDISGVQKGWGKVNEGMRKMYEKEVLGKFPVVQHFWFGGLFEWTGPIRPEGGDGDGDVEMEEMTDSATTRAPWAMAGASPSGMPSATAPWANPAAAAGAAMMPPTRAPWASSPSSAPTAHQPPRSHPSPALPSPSLTSQPLRDPFSNFPDTAHPSAGVPVTPGTPGTPPLEPLKTTAPLGPVRTSSPDSAAAMQSAPQSPRHERRPSGVAAETGDLNEIRRQHSQSRSRSVSISRSRSGSPAIGSLPSASHPLMTSPPPSVASPPLRDPLAPGPSIPSGAVAASTGAGAELEPIKTTAPLGPVRTRSPDSATAIKGGEGEKMDEQAAKARERRKSAVGTGEVAVGETGDLQELRERRLSINRGEGH